MYDHSVLWRGIILIVDFMKLEPSSVKVAKNVSGACLASKEYYSAPLPPFHGVIALER
jgi:hypothetical protein